MSRPPNDAEEYEALLQFLYIAPIGLMQTRANGEILLVNPLCAQLLMPLSRDGGMSNLFDALESVAPDLRSRVGEFSSDFGMVCNALQVYVDAGSSGRGEAQILSLTVLKLDGERLMAVISDITQNVKQERALQQSQAWIQTIVTGETDYALVALDTEGRAKHWNPGIGRVTGFDGQATTGNDFTMFYPPNAMSNQRVQDRLHEADRHGWVLDEGWRLRADGTRYWGSCLLAPLHAPGGPKPDGPSYSLIIRDVSAQRESAEALRLSISCDHLTGLANRRVFFDAMSVELERWTRAPRPLSLLMIDADHFKGINDRHGHAAGDAVLRHLATRMTALFRAMDVVARFGGEEFVVLLPGTNADSAEAVANRLCRALEGESIEFDNRTIGCTVSIGVATMTAEVGDVDGLLLRADQALYVAKANGRNRVERWQQQPVLAAVAAPLT